MKDLIAVMDHSPTGFALINNSGKIIFWNLALEEITKIEASFMLNKSIWNWHQGFLSAIFPTALYSEESIQAWTKNRILPDKESLASKFQSHLAKVDGSSLPVEISCSYIYSRSIFFRCRRRFLAVFLQDLSSQKKREEIIERAGKDRVHDMKVALNNIIGFSELLADAKDFLPTETILEYASVINQSGHHLLELINSYPLLEKMEAGNFILEKSPIHIDAFLDKIRPLQEYFKRIYSVSLEISSSVVCTEIYIHEALLRSVIENLLKNAAEASPVNKKIYISVDEGAESIYFTIKNLGTILPEVKENLFQKYATAGKENGTGLGLYHAKLIAEAHGGSICQYSDEGDVTFVVKIPHE